MADHHTGRRVKSPPSQRLRRRLAKFLPSLFMRPFMTPPEFRLFAQYSQVPGHIVEFGSGGSTLYYLRRQRIVYSVDNNAAFYAYLNSIALVRWMKARNKLHFCYVDIGPTGNWGYPLSEVPEERWTNYYQAVWQSPGAKDPAILLVDGRFRVMCLLNAIGSITTETVVIVHDFWARPHYHDVLNFYDCLDRIDTLAILKLRENIDPVLLAEMRAQFAYDFR